MRKEKERVWFNVKDKKGNVLNNEIQIMERWREYFKDLLEEETQLQITLEDRTQDTADTTPREDNF